uniref:3'(2'),5'-bisphosphate nucleotidase 1 n=1 Tax=Cyprinus carpio TaxID=7962 RepID=A0A8C2DRV7_CYPCA
MASRPAVLMRLMASAYAVAEKAGTIVRKVLQSGELGIVEKVCFIIFIKERYSFMILSGKSRAPGGAVRAELKSDDIKSCPDQYASLKEEELVVWVDPLDGTKEYTEGLLDHVTVLIGIAYGGKAIAGVINQPFYNYQMGTGASLGRTLWGVLGLGAFGFQLQEVPDGKRIITTTRSHSNKLVIDTVQAMEPHDVIRVGGAGNKIIQLVEGKASAYVFASPGCKKWDTCAPEAILHAVGGKLTDMHGNAYTYDANVKHMNSAGVLATLRNHEYYLSRVPQAVLQALPSN